MLSTFILFDTLFVIGVVIYFAISGLFKSLFSNNREYRYIEYKVKNKFSEDKEYYVIDADYSEQYGIYSADIRSVHSNLKKSVFATSPEDLETQILQAYEILKMQSQLL